MNHTVYRLSGEEDREELLKFWNENHEKNLDEKYQWIYEGNPAGKAVVFLIKDSKKGECVGCQAVFSRQFSIKGANLRAASVGGLFVNKEYRTLWPALELGRKIISLVQDENEFDLFYGFPNEKAQSVMKFAGFRCLGCQLRIAKPIKTSEELQKLHIPKYVIRAISPLLDAALKICSFETWYRSKEGFICEELSHFDERFDRLWLESKSRFQALGERTSEYLTWKFLENPDTEHKIFAIASSDKTEVKGYIIYCDDEGSINMRDFIFPEDKRAFRIFLTHFLRHVRKVSPKSILIQLLENKEMVHLFRKFGFVKRKSDLNAYYCCNEHVLKRFPVLEDSENWLLLNSDLDN